MGVKERRRDHMKFLLKHALSHHICCFCKEPLVLRARLTLAQVHDFTVHHQDGNHHNDDPENTVFCHKTCHRSYHMTQMRAKQEDEKKIQADILAYKLAPYKLASSLGESNDKLL